MDLQRLRRRLDALRSALTDVEARLESVEDARLQLDEAAEWLAACAETPDALVVEWVGALLMSAAERIRGFALRHMLGAEHGRRDDRALVWIQARGAASEPRTRRAALARGRQISPPSAAERRLAAFTRLLIDYSEHHHLQITDHLGAAIVREGLAWAGTLFECRGAYAYSTLCLARGAFRLTTRSDVTPRPAALDVRVRVVRWADSPSLPVGLTADDLRFERWRDSSDKEGRGPIHVELEVKSRQIAVQVATDGADPHGANVARRMALLLLNDVALDDSCDESLVRHEIDVESARAIDFGAVLADEVAAKHDSLVPLWSSLRELERGAREIPRERGPA